MRTTTLVQARITRLGEDARTGDPRYLGVVRSLALALVLLAALVPATSVAGSGRKPPPRARRRSSRRSAARSTHFEHSGVFDDSSTRRRSSRRPARIPTAMLNQGFFSHESADGTSFASRLRRFYRPTRGYWIVGENLAMAGPERAPCPRAGRLMDEVSASSRESPQPAVARVRRRGAFRSVCARCLRRRTRPGWSRSTSDLAAGNHPRL